MTVASIKQKQAEALIGEAKADLEQGRLPVRMFSDQGVFELENERLWTRAWHFLGHESEIPKPGDYVVRSIGPYDSLILYRDEGGAVRAFNNICAHRGMRLCRAEMGNTSHFRCPYHGWTYNDKGRLIGVPYRSVAYGDYPVLQKYELARCDVESYKGFVFGNLSEKHESISDYLGDFKWYFDFMIDRTEGGMFFYPPTRHVANFNWKIAAENFSTDNYHVQTLHKFAVELGFFPEGGAAFNGYQTSINGHAICITTGEPAELPRPMFYPVFWPEYVEMIKKKFTPDMFEAFRKVGAAVVGTIFPNLSFLESSVEGKGSFLTFRIWRPLGPDETEFMAWFVTPKETPENVRKNAFEDYIHGHSVAGTLEQDDMEVWKQITKNSRFLAAKEKHLTMNYDVGLRQRPVEPKEWPGPGHIVRTPNENNAIEWWKQLINYLQD
jgi:PAH dioxygenase large subunit